MIDPELIDAFSDYIKFPAKSLEENELRDDAPLTALLAFDKFKETIANAKKHGIEV
jgi:hypothetical protein